MQKIMSRNRNAGFTLIELLIVMAILIIIIALIFPIIYRQYDEAKIAQTRLTIENEITKTLEMYALDHNGAYPTTQQGGLEVLAGKGLTVAPMPGTPGSEFSGTNPTQPGIPNMPGGMQPGGMTDPSMPGMMPGGTQPGGMQPGGMTDPSMPGMMPGGAQPGAMPMSDPMMPPTAPDASRGVGTADPTMMGGMPTNPGMPNDPMNPMAGSAGGMPTTTQTSAVSMTHGSGMGKNYFGEGAQLPKDSWGHNFFYEYPTHRTVSGKPAIWSAGPNGKEGDMDDIISWKKELDAIANDPAAKAAYDAKQQGAAAPGMTGPGMPQMPQMPGQPNPAGMNDPMMQPNGMQPGGMQPNMMQPNSNNGAVPAPGFPANNNPAPSGMMGGNTMPTTQPAPMVDPMMPKPNNQPPQLPPM